MLFRTSVSVDETPLPLAVTAPAHAWKENGPHLRCSLAVLYRAELPATPRPALAPALRVGTSTEPVFTANNIVRRQDRCAWNATCTRRDYFCKDYPAGAGMLQQFDVFAALGQRCCQA